MTLLVIKLPPLKLNATIIAQKPPQGKKKMYAAFSVRRLLLSAKEVITSDALIFLSPKTQETEAIRNEQLQYRA
jgi:hypothetical protein